MRKRSSKHLVLIETILRYEHASGAWIVLLNYLGLSPNDDLNKFAGKMAELQSASAEAKKEIANLIRDGNG